MPYNMDYFYERNISEIKNEYTTFLIGIITPFIYEGIKSVYQFSLSAHDEFVEKGKYDPNIKSPGVLKLFQLSLKEIPTLNNNSIEVETNRIKNGSKCSEWFDDLVKAVIKSHIVLMIFANPKKRSEILKEEYHNKIDIKDFIHKCYIESARLMYNNPELYWHEFPSLEIKRNQREACELIKQAIQEGIRKMLPYKMILREYLQNNFIDDLNDNQNIHDPHDQYMTIKDMVKRDLHGGMNENVVKQYNHPVNDSILETSTTHVKEEDYMDNSDSTETSSESSQTDDDKKVEDYLNSIKADLSQRIEDKEKKEEKVEQKEEVKEEIKEDVPDKVSNLINEINNDIKKDPKIAVPGSIPRADSDDEIKELLKKSHIVTNIDKSREKMNGRELTLINEIEEKEKPKSEEPDRKSFFEQYMK